MTAGSLAAISRVHFPVTALGPGRRVGIWFQGCRRRCPGCVSPETWAFGAPALPVPDLVDFLAPSLKACDGATITGGEPLEQPEALEELLRSLRRLRSGSLLLFTGLPFAEAAAALDALSPLVDAAVCGPYEEASPQTLALRGSDNQTLHLLTPLGRDEFSRYLGPEDPGGGRLDFMFDADGTVWFAGIPRRGDMARLRLLAEGRRPAAPARDPEARGPAERLQAARGPSGC